MQPHRYIFNLQLTTAGTESGVYPDSDSWSDLDWDRTALGFAWSLVPAGRANINIDSINYKNIKCRPTNVIKRIKQLQCAP